MRRIYSLVFWLLLPFIILRLLWRSRKAPAYRRRMLERLALFKALQQGGLWVHAVSLGEVIAATPLIKRFQQQYPDAPVTITTMTPTGSQKVIQTFGDTVFHVYLPYDIPSIINRFLNKLRPEVLVIIETELWPNMIHCARKRGIKILLANARLSARSARNYQRIAKITKTMLCQIDCIATQTEIEKQRYVKLGMPSDRVMVTGSIKFDIAPPKDLADKTEALRRMLGPTRDILIAASTHDNEEQQILEIFSKVRQSLPNLLLLLVPRHPDRFNDVIQLCKRQGFNIVLRSENQACSSNTDVFIGNTMGEMMLFYSVCDVAFVGGSLVPVGGHNLLEPAALAKAAITGPHMHNFLEITQMLLNANAIMQINNQDELANAVIKYLNDAELRQRAGEAGRQVVLQNRGALQKQFDLLQGLYETKSDATAQARVELGAEL